MQSMQRKPNYKQNSDSSVDLNINAILKTTNCGVISTREPWRWKTQTNYEFYRQLLSVHEWSHSRAWMGLCTTLVHSEESLKIQVNSPMRLGLEIRHGDKLPRPRYESVPQKVPCGGDCVCWHSWKDKPEAEENSLFSTCRVLGVLSLAVPTSTFFQAIDHSVTGPSLHTSWLSWWPEVCTLHIHTYTLIKSAKLWD